MLEGYQLGQVIIPGTGYLEIRRVKSEIESLPQKQFRFFPHRKRSEERTYARLFETPDHFERQRHQIFRQHSSLQWAPSGKSNRIRVQQQKRNQKVEESR